MKAHDDQKKMTLEAASVQTSGNEETADTTSNEDTTPDETKAENTEKKGDGKLMANKDEEELPEA